MKIELSCSHCDWVGRCPRHEVYNKAAEDIKESLQWLGVIEREDLSIKLSCAMIQDNRPLDIPNFVGGRLQYAKL